jgi:hypothetical protein
MMDIRKSSDLSHARPDDVHISDNAIASEALRIENIASKPNRSESRTRCARCNSQVLVMNDYSRDLLDLNRKRHFCNDVDRILHEEKCVIRLQSILEYYNQTEFSSQQVEMGIV